MDDIIFIRDFDTHWIKDLDLQCTVPSIRLDDRVTFSQPSGQNCPPPSMKASPDSPWLEYSWTDAIGPWAMPLSVDGNVFDRREILVLLEGIAFKAPNSLEKALGPYRFWFKRRRGYCLPQRGIINLALNRVQQENEDFPCGECNAHEMLLRWQSGQRLDWLTMAEAEDHSTHVVANPVYINKEVLG